MDGDGKSRVFLATGASTALKGIKITNGNSDSYAGGVYTYSNEMTISDCVISGNRAQGKGGGVIGGLISYGLQLLVAKPGTLIILIPATLVLAMVLFSLSIVRAGKKVAHAGGKVKGWLSGVVERFRKSDAANKEKRKKAAEERAQKGTEGRRRTQCGRECS